jgi:hypothetical protein
MHSYLSYVNRQALVGYELERLDGIRKPRRERVPLRLRLHRRHAPRLAPAGGC